MTRKIEQIQNLLGENEAAFITDNSNRFYLTQFRSSAGTIFITKKSAHFFIDFRYFEKAKRQIKGFNVVLQSKLTDQLCKIISEEKISVLLVETNRMTLERYSFFSRNLGVQISEDDKLDKKIELMRSVKSSEELKYIKTAQQYLDKTFEYILTHIEPGRTEREIMLDMEFFMRKLGSDGVAFDFIVVSGKNTSLPHGEPTDKKVEIGDFITMDFGAVENGYRSDMTRTVAVGNVSSAQRDVYNTVLNAQLTALDNIKPGAVCKEIDKIARDIINSKYNGCFGHGLGHSIGVETHESPCFNTSCETVLTPNMVLTVEPGIYIENTYGVRIEDMVVVTDNGYENLTKSSKELIII